MRIPLRSIVACATIIAAVAMLFFGSMRVPAIAMDAASTVRGSLGVSIEELGLGNNLGEVVFLLNGAFALLFSAVACFAVAGRRRRKPIRNGDYLGKLPSGISAVDRLI
jgi:hypothetical protein